MSTVAYDLSALGRVVKRAKVGLDILVPEIARVTVLTKGPEDSVNVSTVNIWQLDFGAAGLGAGGGPLRVPCRQGLPCVFSYVSRGGKIVVEPLRNSLALPIFDQEPAQASVADLLQWSNQYEQRFPLVIGS